jgi:L-threonylcarbamoyladenylate synthase
MIWFRIEQDDDPRLRAVADSLLSGGIAILPTETVYGLSASALDTDAIERIIGAKGRADGKPFIILAETTDQAKSLFNEWPSRAQRLADAFWPGPVSLVLNKSELVPSAATAGGETVAVRVPGLALLRRVISLAGVPLVSTSANRSDCPPPQTADEAVRQLGLAVDYVVDKGPQGTVPSTLVDLTEGSLRILREGAIRTDSILAAVE